MTYVLIDNGHVSSSEQVALLDRCVRTGKLISGIIRSLNRND